MFKRDLIIDILLKLFKLVTLVSRFGNYQAIIFNLTTKIIQANIYLSTSAI